MALRESHHFSHHPYRRDVAPGGHQIGMAWTKRSCEGFSCRGLVGHSLRRCHRGLTDHLKNPPEHANAYPRSRIAKFNVAAAASPEAQVSSAQALESNAVGPDDIR